jgi:hypothetical protein
VGVKGTSLNVAVGFFLLGLGGEGDGADSSSWLLSDGILRTLTLEKSYAEKLRFSRAPGDEEN